MEQLGRRGGSKAEEASFLDQMQSKPQKKRRSTAKKKREEIRKKEENEKENLPQKKPSIQLSIKEMMGKFEKMKEKKEELKPEESRVRMIAREWGTRSEKEQRRNEKYVRKRGRKTQLDDTLQVVDQHTSIGLGDENQT